MSPKKKVIELEIASRLDELTRVEKMTEDVAAQMGLSEDQKNNLAIAVTEAAGNAIVHGNKKDKNKKVRLIFTLASDSVQVSISDQGPGFDPQKLANPLDPENMMKESGRGIFIMKALMDGVSFSDNGSTITFLLKKKD